MLHVFVDGGREVRIEQTLRLGNAEKIEDTFAPAAPLLIIEIKGHRTIINIKPKPYYK